MELNGLEITDWKKLNIEASTRKKDLIKLVFTKDDGTKYYYQLTKENAKFLIKRLKYAIKLRG